MIGATTRIDVSFVRDRVTRLFRGVGGPPTRIGAEIELFPLRVRAGHLEPASRADVEPALSLAPGLDAHAATSFEPGGQLELSLHPATGAGALLARARAALGAAGGALGLAGLGTFAAGTDPLEGRMAWDLQCDGPRYRAMQAHFDRLGGRGRRMMRQTASLQVCVETPRADAGRSAWRLLNLAGPALSAAFADSPVIDGPPPGSADGRPVSNRLAVWLATDASRTGFDGVQLGGADAVEAYAEFALDATVIGLPRPGGARLPDGLTLRRWLQGADAGASPEAADVDHHLSTLFPPVRPRGAYFEVRYLDALPWRWACAATHVVAALAHDPAATAAGLEITGHRDGLPSAWERACSAGPRDAELAAQACALIDVAAAAARRRSGGLAAERLLHECRERFPASGRCPGDDLAELLARCPEELPAWT